nr:hypothetical protein [uncultured Amphritea sp.]
MRSSLTLSASISIQGRGFSSPLRSSVATGDSVAGTRRTPPYLPWQVWVERLGASMPVGGKKMALLFSYWQVADLMASNLLALFF